MQTPAFMPGIELSQLFHEEVVRPLLAKRFPNLEYSAALLGDGSDVLGFDTPMSTDHDWGPRVFLFLSDTGFQEQSGLVKEALARDLPPFFRGWSVLVPPGAPGVGETAAPGPPHHRVVVTTVREFVKDALAFDISREIEPADWLTFPQQCLRGLVGGAVFHDGVGIQTARDRFTWYPHDVWLYLLSSGWRRIGQEQHLMGRAGSVGDELGASIIGSRLVRDVMRLCFLMEREYAPYAKWFGTAFAGLRCGPELTPILRHPATRAV